MTEEEFMKKVPRWIATAVGGFFLFIILINSMWRSDLGYQYAYQNTITGDKAMIAEPGVHFRVPFFSRVTKYRQVITLSFDGTNGNTTYAGEPIDVTFADTYSGNVPITFRFKLTPDEQAFLKLHEEFRTFNNLVEAMLVKNAKNVAVVTATQFTGEEFFQGGLNGYKVRLQDQLSGGLYETERRQVEVEESSFAPVTRDQTVGTKVERTKTLVMKTVPVRDENGHIKRQHNPLAEYGIEVRQVVVDKPVPEERLNTLLKRKKELVAERISAEQEQETAKAQAETAQLREEIEKNKAIQIANRDKELAVIAERKKVEIEQEKKAYALVLKQKELEMAEADRDIQKAADQAATYEASRIRKQGMAQADVTRANYAALQSAKDIYLAEIQRDVAQVMYTNLKDFKVDMPDVMISGTDSDPMTSNDVLQSLLINGMLSSTK